MKNLLIIILFCAIRLDSKAENDSCIASLVIESDTVIIGKADTCEEFYTSKIDTIVEIEVKETVQKLMHAKLKKKKALNSKNPQDFGGFLSDLWDALSSLWKPVWGNYEENRMNHTGPYFLFNRDSDNA